MYVYLYNKLSKRLEDCSGVNLVTASLQNPFQTYSLSPTYLYVNISQSNCFPRTILTNFEKGYSSQRECTLYTQHVFKWIIMSETVPYLACPACFQPPVLPDVNSRKMRDVRTISLSHIRIGDMHRRGRVQDRYSQWGQKSTKSLRQQVRYIVIPTTQHLWPSFTAHAHSMKDIQQKSPMQFLLSSLLASVGRRSHINKYLHTLRKRLRER